MENSHSNFIQNSNKNNQLKENKLTDNIKSIKMRNYLNTNQTRDKYHMTFKGKSGSENFNDEYNIFEYKTNYLSGFSGGHKESHFKTGTNFYKPKFNKTEAIFKKKNTNKNNPIKH